MTANTESFDERALRTAVGFYERQIDRTAADLRRLADRIEQSKNVSRGKYVDAVGDVIREIHNAMPNLPLTILLDAAQAVEYVASEADKNGRSRVGS